MGRRRSASSFGPFMIVRNAPVLAALKAISPRDPALSGQALVPARNYAGSQLSGGDPFLFLSSFAYSQLASGTGLSSEGLFFN